MNMSMSDFYCTCCGNKGIPIMRRKGKEREAGHLKKLFCLTCQKETNHVEIRAKGKYTYEDFRMELECGRFVNGQRTPVSELTICSRKSCSKNVNGRCWNSNNSKQCQHKRGDI